MQSACYRGQVIGQYKNTSGTGSVPKMLTMIACIGQLSNAITHRNRYKNSLPYSPSVNGIPLQLHGTFSNPAAFCAPLERSVAHGHSNSDKCEAIL